MRRSIEKIGALLTIIAACNATCGMLKILLGCGSAIINQYFRLPVNEHLNSMKYGTESVNILNGSFERTGPPTGRNTEHGMRAFVRCLYLILEKTARYNHFSETAWRKRPNMLNNTSGSTLVLVGLSTNEEETCAESFYCLW